MLARHIRPSFRFRSFVSVIDDVLDLGMDAVAKVGSMALAGGPIPGVQLQWRGTL